jgi:hypothetical protein
MPREDGSLKNPLAFCFIERIELELVGFLARTGEVKYNGMLKFR